VTDDHIPDLTGEVTNEEGADHFWDFTREKKRRTWVDGDETTEQHPHPPITSWTSDDPGTGEQTDEDNNPYDGPRSNPSGPPTGEIFSFDCPAYNAALASLGTEFGGWGASSTCVRKHIFREWVRLRLDDTWYSCSNYGYWRAYRSIIKEDGEWQEDDSGPNAIDNTNTGW